MFFRSPDNIFFLWMNFEIKYWKNFLKTNLPKSSKR